MSTPTAATLDDRRRAIATVRAYLHGDAAGLDVLLADVVPPIRDADTDPIGAVLDEKRAAPVAAMVERLSSLVAFFASDEGRDPRAADARLAALIPDPAAGTVG